MPELLAFPKTRRERPAQTPSEAYYHARKLALLAARQAGLRAAGNQVLGLHFRVAWDKAQRAALRSFAGDLRRLHI